jgi:hypothetical protein
MTSQVRVRRRHRLPEGNLGFSKPSYDETAGAGNFRLAISVTASAQNVAPVVTTPIAPFTVFAGAPARSIDLTTAFADPDASNAVQLSVSLPSSRGIFTIALDGQHKPVAVGNFLNYVNSGRYFATDATSCKAADLSARSIQPNPPSWSPSHW